MRINRPRRAVFVTLLTTSTFRRICLTSLYISVKTISIYKVCLFYDADKIVKYIYENFQLHV